jgi:hypothetical protein
VSFQCIDVWEEVPERVFLCRSPLTLHGDDARDAVRWGSEYVARLEHTKAKGADIKRQLEQLKEARRLKKQKLTETEEATAMPSDAATMVMAEFDWKTKSVGGI